MELVHGEDVHSAVVGKRLPAERVIPMLLSAGEAISFAHGKGLVHRDVKPANILLDADGLPRITDFDLVWARDTTGGTRSGALGTFLYAAPELMHRPQDADARADVYGLGMTAVFCFHGAELPPIMMRYPGRVIERLPCSDAVRKVLERAIEFEASERFPDVAAFCEALRSAGAGKSGPPLEGREGVRWLGGGLKDGVQRDLLNGGLVRRAIEQAILDPRAARVQGPVMLTESVITVGAEIAEEEEQIVVAGRWSLGWPQHPIPGAAEGPFEERGTFRCGILVEELGELRAQQVTYRSEFFESLIPWVDVPAGTLLMGSPDEDSEAYDDERPQRPVAIAAFALAATPITMGHYAAVMGRIARPKDEATHPVTMVTWERAIRFCNALSRLAGRHPCYRLSPDRTTWLQYADGFRLPKESEWEYACRAGTTTRYFFGDDKAHLGEFAWYSISGEGRAAPVGHKNPNPWNLYDMHGNIWEWTWDEYRGFHEEVRMGTHEERTARRPDAGVRVVRGGSITDEAKQLRSASRIGYNCRHPSPLIGFRCVGPARRRG